MTHDTTTTHPANGRAAEDYRTSDGLRALLNRLHAAGKHAWEHDPVAAELMQFAAEKYAAHRDQAPARPVGGRIGRVRRDAHPKSRTAEDPWAVVTHAVRITCIAEERGQGLLCSTHQARRPRYSVFHDAERLSDRENVLSDYHPAFQVQRRPPRRYRS